MKTNWILIVLLSGLLPACGQHVQDAAKSGTSVATGADPASAPTEPLKAERIDVLSGDRLASVEPGEPTSGEYRPARPVGTEAQSVQLRAVSASPPPVAQLDVPVAGKLVSGAGMHSIRPAAEPVDRENYGHFEEGRTFLVADDPVSTFSIDVDTGSYAVVRRMLNQGRLPVHDAVRIEEMINYFDYAYAGPEKPDQPFAVHTEMGPNPWNPGTRLLQVGIKGYTAANTELPPANLVFLVDVSGSMRSADKLELLKSSLRLLVNQLRPEDRIAITVYAGASGLALPSTAGDQKATILAALQNLAAGGSTNGAAGIRLAYQVARQHFVDGGINRVILATDGDFNVGTVNIEALKELVAAQRESGVTLTTLGFGSGNYNDHLMEQIADIGNGNYAYIDRLAEARKVLVEQMAGTLRTIAQDVKIQVEFNPALVSEYRLVGYENRVLRREDFNNDRVDAGDIGEGHTVTALYEVRLAGSDGGRIDPLRYGKTRNTMETRLVHNPELAYLKLRYKQPGAGRSQLISRPVHLSELQANLQSTSDRYRFATAVAGFGQLLRGGRNTEAFGFADVLRLAEGARSDDRLGYRGEFIGLVRLAEAIATPLSRAGDARRYVTE